MAHNYHNQHPMAATTTTTYPADDIVVAVVVDPYPGAPHQHNRLDLDLGTSHSYNSNGTMNTSSSSTARLQQRRRRRGLDLVLADGGGTMNTTTDDDSNGQRQPQHQQQQQQQQRGRTTRRRRRNSKKRIDDTDEPFACLVWRVAITLALVMVIGGSTTYARFWKSSPTAPDDAPDDDLAVDASVVVAATTTRVRPQQQQQQHEEEDPKAAILRIQQQHAHLEDPPPQEQESAAPQPQNPEPLGSAPWHLSDRARQWDAYALAEQHPPSQSNDLFWSTAAELRARFAETYAPQANTTTARALVEQSLTTSTRSSTTTTTASDSSQLPPYDLFQTACRMRSARRASRPFSMAFAGYSVTTGRGNHFHQAYPNVLETLLRPAFQHLNMSLQVRNAAIGGCPSFPYGWCLANFLGTTTTFETAPRVDVVSWDFRMNEAGGNPVGLEAYLRHVLSSQNAPPQFVVHDTYTALPRQQLLQQYATRSPFRWRDHVILHTDVTVRPWLVLPELERPVGFREWRQFGAPLHAPGQSAHHPAVAEHLFLAWILALHWLNALELVALADDPPTGASYDLEPHCRDDYDNYDRAATPRGGRFLPPPVYPGFNYSEPWTSILFGQPVEGSTATHPDNNSNNELWKMNAVHCRTSFEPIVYGHLSNIIVSGTTAQDLDVMLPKSNQFYHGHWVWDMSDAEKQAKRQLDRYGGLGFVDRKPAYYGIYPSGTLTLWLPYEPADHPPGASLPQPNDPATTWFQSVVVCQVNEGPSHHRPSNNSPVGDASVCQTWRDVLFTIGGVPVTSVTALQAPGTVYLGRPLCAHMTIPAMARLTARPPQHNDHNNNSSESLEPPPGLLVTATVHNSHIVQRDQACSISHVVWEQRDKDDKSWVL